MIYYIRIGLQILLIERHNIIAYSGIHVYAATFEMDLKQCFEHLGLYQNSTSHAHSVVKVNKFIHKHIDMYLEDMQIACTGKGR